MKIEIRDNAAIGLLEFSSRIYLQSVLLSYLSNRLYNFEFYIWYDYEYDRSCVKMKGSIVSMMQFRKFVLITWPNALKE